MITFLLCLLSFVAGSLFGVVISSLCTIVKGDPYERYLDDLEREKSVR